MDYTKPHNLKLARKAFLKDLHKDNDFIEFRKNNSFVIGYFGYDIERLPNTSAQYLVTRYVKTTKNVRKIKVVLVDEEQI
jgi:hypothetical protein